VSGVRRNDRCAQFYHAAGRFDREIRACYNSPQEPAMLYSPTFMPLLHGAAGILDELLLCGLPLLVVLIILIINSRRARKNAQPRERTPQDKSSPPHD
jgi:hypothetical protein